MRVSGTSEKLHDTVTGGLVLAGVHHAEVGEIASHFASSDHLREAAKKFGFNWLQSQLKTEFTVLETIPMIGDFRIPPEQFLRDGQANPQYWVYHGESHRRQEQSSFDLVIGIFNKPVSMEEALYWAVENGYKGSGAWIRRIYAICNPDYDGRGPMLFPAKDSIWENTETHALHMPGLWHDSGSAGRESLEPMSSGQRPGRRFAFIANEQVVPKTKLHLLK